MPRRQTRAGRLRLRDHRPELANLWLRHSLAVRPREDAAWIDLSSGRLMPGSATRTGGGRQQEPTDLVYLPAVATDRMARVEEARAVCSEGGVPTLAHVIVGLESAVRTGSSEAYLVADPLHALLGGDLECLGRIRDTAVAIWPLLPGVTDSEELVADGLERLSGAGVACVVPIAPQIDPGSARAVTERYGEALFAALFHPGPADLRSVLRAIARQGLDFLPPRPGLRSGRGFERRVAAELAAIAEFMLLLEESPATAQEFFRAGAWFEATHHDVAAMVREGNLELVPVAGPALRPVVEELSQGAERSRILVELIARLADEPP